MKLGEKLTEGPIFKKFVLFVIPVVITSFLQQMYNAADTVIVGQCVGKHALAALYMKLFFLGVPASLIYNFGSAVLRAIGETKKPLYILSVAGVANVVLNYVFVAILNHGVVGVALGTIVSQVISAVWVIVIFVKNRDELHLSLKKLRIYRKELLKILSIGIPSGLNGIMFSLSGVIIQTAINSFKATAIAAHSATWNYMAFSNLLVAAGEQGCISFVGQNMGARKYDRVRKTVKIGMLSTLTASVVFSLAIVVFARPLIGIFTKEADIIECGMKQIYCAISVYFLYVPDLILGGALRGMGKSMIPTVINLVGICLLRVVWILFIFPLWQTLEMVYFSFPVTWIASGIAMGVAYLIEIKKLYGMECER